MEIFFSIFTFFSFKVSLVVSFCTIASYFASSFYEITFLFATLCCIFGSLRSCLRLLVAYGFHLCNFIVVIFAASLLYKSLSLLVATLFCCLFVLILLYWSPKLLSYLASLFSKVSREELLVSLWLIYFLACLLFAFHHLSLKLLERSFFFPYNLLFSCMFPSYFPSLLSKASREELVLCL